MAFKNIVTVTVYFSVCTTKSFMFEIWKISASKNSINPQHIAVKIPWYVVVETLMMQKSVNICVAFSHSAKCLGLMKPIDVYMWQWMRYGSITLLRNQNGLIHNNWNVLVSLLWNVHVFIFEISRQ